jgi:hypothetical protein
MDKQKIISYSVRFFKILLIILAVGLVVFSAMSGAESGGFLKNLPNALPWVLLLAFACLAFKWQIAGGVLTLLFGVFTVFFFNALESVFVLSAISLPLILIGFILALAGLFKK